MFILWLFCWHHWASSFACWLGPARILAYNIYFGSKIRPKINITLCHVKAPVQNRPFPQDPNWAVRNHPPAGVVLTMHYLWQAIVACQRSICICIHFCNNSKKLIAWFPLMTPLIQKLLLIIPKQEGEGKVRQSRTVSELPSLSREAWKVLL